MNGMTWVLLALGAAAFFFLRGFLRSARQNDLWGEMRAAARRWRDQR